MYEVWNCFNFSVGAVISLEKTPCNIEKKITPCLKTLSHCEISQTLIRCAKFEYLGWLNFSPFTTVWNLISLMFVEFGNYTMFINQDFPKCPSASKLGITNAYKDLPITFQN